VYEVELHAHSERSHDGGDPVEDRLDRAATVGLDGLAVTDHDIEAGLRAAELTVDAVLSALADGRTAIRGRRTPFRLTLRQAAGNVRRRARRRFSRR